MKRVHRKRAVRILWSLLAVALVVACALQEQGAATGTGRVFESDGAGGAAGEPGDESAATTGMGGMGAAATTGGTGGTSSAATSSSGGTGGTTGGTGGTATGGTGGCEGGDCCPDDPNKTDPGECGCGVPDDDSDGDLVANCNDACPDDSDKTDPGSCGCGLAEGPGCDGLVAALVHRYSFSGSGATATDAVGTANGMIMGTTLSGSGSLELAGTTSDEYVNLPNGIISELTSATIELWVTWAGGDAWQRVFDFGSNSAGEDMQGTGETYLFLTPQHTDGNGTLQAAFSLNGNGTDETNVSAAAPLPQGQETHVAVVIDASNNQMLLYVDGDLEGSTALSERLSGIVDENNWIGHSQFDDPGFGGSLNEFRIYAEALSAAQIAKSFEAGPAPAFLE